YPHSLSFFNEAVGGPRNGSQHLLGSNLDWGQDLRYVRAWMEDFEIRRLMPFSVLLTYDPNSIGVECSWVNYLSQDMRQIKDVRSSAPFAVSMNYLRDSERRDPGGRMGIKECAGRDVW